jgi:phage terminase small subunit
MMISKGFTAPMPLLKNARHEIFAQEIVKGVSGRDAYKIAGFAVSNDNAADASASRLLRDVKVQARIAELQEKAQARALVTLEEHIEELKDIRDLAKKNGQASAAVAAEVKRGELMGYYVERRESTNTNYNISDKPLNEDDWERQYGGAAPASPHGRNH